MQHLKFGPKLFLPFFAGSHVYTVSTFLSAVNRHVPLGEQFPEVSTYQVLQIQARLCATIPAKLDQVCTRLSLCCRTAVMRREPLHHICVWWGESTM
jgi:hypothetical protein